ncbi:MAG: homoisocitrate dehydrogenase [Haliangiales bacterium]
MNDPANPAAWLIPKPSENRPVVAAVGGDGIGPEIVSAALTCCRAADAPIDIVEPLAEAAPLVQGAPLSESLQATLSGADAILFGAADSGPSGRHISILRYLRWGVDTYVNLRPAVRLLASAPGEAARADANLVIVRELSEGLYPGREGDLAEFQRRWPEFRDALGRPIPDSGRFALRIVTEQGARRIARYAARLAAWRKQRGYSAGHVTVVAKSNVLRQSEGMFVSICREEIEQLGGVEHSMVLVDEAARRLVACPETFDVIVTSNLFGDILSDVAAELMGGMPLAPSAGLGDGPAYFESCHGSAPDIVGQDRANPAATILSSAMMLAYLGFAEHAERLVSATVATIDAGCKTPDLGGSATTTSFTDEVCARLTA